jgi:hypothetical protein
VTRAGGGAGCVGGSNTAGGDGGGGSHTANSGPSGSGTVNTGSGAGGGTNTGANRDGGAGGSGVVILRVPTASYSGTTSGSPTVSTSGTDTILVFNASGSYTA